MDFIVQDLHRLTRAAVTTQGNRSRKCRRRLRNSGGQLEQAQLLGTCQGLRASVRVQLAVDVLDVRAEIATFQGEANAYLSEPSYNALRLRLENAHAAVEAAAVEARRRVRLNEGRQGGA